MNLGIVDKILNELEDIPNKVDNIKDRKRLASSVYQKLCEYGISYDDADAWLFDFLYIKEGRQRPGAEINYDLVPNDQKFDPDEKTEKMDVRPNNDKKSIIDAIGYDSQQNTLQINFKNGSIYRYNNVPEDILSQLRQSEDKQEFFYSNIRYNYPAKRIKKFDEPKMNLEILFVREEIKPSLKRGYQDTPDITDDEIDRLAKSIINRNKGDIANKVS